MHKKMECHITDTKEPVDPWWVAIDEDEAYDAQRQAEIDDAEQQLMEVLDGHD